MFVQTIILLFILVHFLGVTFVVNVMLINDYINIDDSKIRSQNERLMESRIKNEIKRQSGGGNIIYAAFPPFRS